MEEPSISNVPSGDSINFIRDETEEVSDSLLEVDFIDFNNNKESRQESPRDIWINKQSFR